MDLVSALEEIDAVSHVASSFQTPDARQEFEDVGEMTVFAPVSDAFTQRSLAQSGAEDLDESADNNSYTQWPATTLLRAHLVPEESLSMSELLERGEVTLADGSRLEILLEDGVARVWRDTVTADVLCGDIQV